MIAQSLKYGVAQMSDTSTRPDPVLGNLLTPNVCRKHGIVPWGKQAWLFVIATCNPDGFLANMKAYPELSRRVTMVLCSK